MMKWTAIWIAAFLALAMTAVPLMADETEKALIGDIYSGDRIETDQFSPAFLNILPIARLRGISESLRAEYGAMVSLAGEAGQYRLETETHAIPVRITLDADGQIVALFFEPPTALTEDFDATLETIAALPGKIAYLVITDGETVAERNADEPLAVGSAFKLGVLAALKRQIEAGGRSWEDVVRLEDGDRSLGSGLLHTMPTGSPLTVHSVAALMIAQSDNTATDLMMRIVGRGAVAQALGVDTLLTTREFFVLKGDAELRERYVSDPEWRATMPGELAAAPLPDPSLLGVHDEGVQWHVPARRLCALLEEVADLDVISTNAGPARRDEWDQAAFKGGSEIGVLNLSTHATAKDGRTVCLVVTVNARQAIAESDVLSLYGRALQQLAGSQ